jgi:hypothetical protein
MKRSLFLFAATAGLLGLAGPQARAGLIPAPTAQWSYNFTPSSPFVSAKAPGTGTVTFTNEPTKSATGSSDVVVTDLRVSSTAPSTHPDTLSGSGAAYSIALKLTDTASGASAVLTFTGKLSGTFSGSNSNVSNAFTGKISDTVVLGTNVYTVGLTGYTPPGPPTASNSGSISAHVSVQAQSGTGSGGGNGNTPEPSSLVLSFLGLTFAGAASWHKRRRSLAARLA